jgi:hypothetical protein
MRAIKARMIRRVCRRRRNNRSMSILRHCKGRMESSTQYQCNASRNSAAKADAKWEQKHTEMLSGRDSPCVFNALRIHLNNISKNAYTL